MANGVCVEAIRSLFSGLVSAIRSDIELLYDEAYSRHLIDNRSSAVDPGDKARDLLQTIISRIETDTSRKPYDDFIAILRKRGNLQYLAVRIEEERQKLSSEENVDSGLVPSRLVSEQNGCGEEFEDSSTSPGHGDTDNSSNSGGGVMPFPPTNEDLNDSDNLQAPCSSFLQESQMQSEPPVMIFSGDAMAKFEEDRLKVLELKAQIERLKAEVLEQVDTKRHYEEQLAKVTRKLSDKEGELMKKSTEIKSLEDNIKKLKQDAKQRDEQLNKYKREIEKREKEKVVYEEKLNEYQHKIQGKEENVQELEKENEELKRKYKKAESELEDLRSRIATVEKEQNKTKALCKALQRQLEEQNRKFATEREMMRLKHDNDMHTIAAEVERVTRQIEQERVKRMEDRLRRESETKQAEIDSLKEKLSRARLS